VYGRCRALYVEHRTSKLFGVRVDLGISAMESAWSVYKKKVNKTEGIGEMYGGRVDGDRRRGEVPVRTQGKGRFPEIRYPSDERG
jgi:hypothetical protein